MPEPAQPSSRGSAWEWVQCALVGANLAWTTLHLGGVRAETQAVTFVLALVLLGVHLLSRFTDGRAAAWHPAGWWLAPFLIYAAANAAWVTPVPWLGWMDWLGWWQMLIVFWVVLNGLPAIGPRRFLLFTLVGLGLAGVLLACYQRFVRPDWMFLGRVQPGDLGGRASGMFGIPNSFAGFLLLLLPATGALTLRRGATPAARVWWGWVSGVLFFGLVLTISRGAWVALAMALTLWPLAAARGGWRRRLGLSALVLVLTGIVGGAIYARSPKVRARYAALVLDAGERTRPVMWQAAWRLFQEKPATGWGAGSYNVVFERFRPEGFRDEPLWAHNEYLNTLSDYGAIGFLLLFGGIGVVAVRCGFGRREDRPRRREDLESPLVVSGLGIGLLALGLQASLDFHFKIPALAQASAVVAALAVGRAWARSAEPVPRSGVRARAGGAVAIAAVVAVAVIFWPRIRAEALRQDARRTIDSLAGVPPAAPDYASRLAGARTALGRATAQDAGNGQAWADYSYATALTALVEPGRTEELGREAERLADRAIARAGICSEFWIRRGVARDMQGRWAEAGKDFAAAVALAPADAYAWYYTADHLSRVKSQAEPAEAALAFCLRLDPGNPAGLALRQRLAINSKAH